MVTGHSAHGRWLYRPSFIYKLIFFSRIPLISSLQATLSSLSGSRLRTNRRDLRWRHPVTWSYTDCGITSPLRLKNKEGTSSWWFSMQVVNAAAPVTELEVSADGRSTWQGTTREYYNYFENSGGFRTDYVDVKVTGESGSTVRVWNVGVSSGSSVTASSNL